MCQMAVHKCLTAHLRQKSSNLATAGGKMYGVRTFASASATTMLNLLYEMCVKIEDSQLRLVSHLHSIHGLSIVIVMYRK